MVSILSTPISHKFYFGGSLGYGVAGFKESRQTGSGLESAYYGDGFLGAASIGVTLIRKIISLDVGAFGALSNVSHTTSNRSLGNRDYSLQNIYGIGIAPGYKFDQRVTMHLNVYLVQGRFDYNVINSFDESFNQIGLLTGFGFVAMLKKHLALTVDTTHTFFNSKSISTLNHKERPSLTMVLLGLRYYF